MLLREQSSAVERGRPRQELVDPGFDLARESHWPRELALADMSMTSRKIGSAVAAG